MSEIKRVIVVGAGGVGFGLTEALCRDKPDLEIIVYDDDNFLGGYGAQRLPKVVNKETKKVDFLRGYIRMVMGDRPPIVRDRKFDELEAEAECGPSTLFVDASDMSLEQRQPIWRAVRATGCETLRVSYDGNGIVVISRGLPFSTNPGGNYSRVPTRAQSLWAGGVGAAAVEKLLAGEEVGDYQMELKGGGQ